MFKKINKAKLNAFTLSEMLITLAIIGILVLMALPTLMPLIVQTKALEAKLQLRHVATLEKSYYYINSKYSSDITDIGFEQAKLVTNDGHANYKIDIVDASVKTFKAKATAVVDFDGDGQFNVWEIDSEENLKEVTKD